MTTESALPIRLRGPVEMARDLAGALTRASALGAPWRGTRFERYDDALRSAAAAPQGQPIASPDGEIYYEALNQAQQLIEAVGLAAFVDAPLLAAKLRECMAGDASPPTDLEHDHARDTLFELTVAHLLADRGLQVGITANDEDVIANHPELPQPLLVECKRPAMSAVHGKATAPVARALRTGRQQLEARRRQRAGHGAVVLALDRLWSQEGKRTLSAPTGAALRDMVRLSLQHAVTDMIRAAEERHIRLAPVISAVGGVFVGTGLAADEQVLYSLMFMHLTLISSERRWGRQFASVLGVEHG